MRLIITTSRHTNPRVRSFVKELANSLGNSIKVNRGKMDVSDLHLYARSLNASRVIIVGRGAYGNPGRITFLDTTREEPRYYPLILRLSGVSLGRDRGLKTVPAKIPTPIVISDPDPETVEFGQELATAFNRPFFEEVDKGLVGEYEKVLIIEKIRTNRVKFVIKFVSRNFKLVGPRIFIRDVILKELPLTRHV